MTQSALNATRSSETSLTRLFRGFRCGAARVRDDIPLREATATQRSSRTVQFSASLLAPLLVVVYARRLSRLMSGYGGVPSTGPIARGAGMYGQLPPEHGGVLCLARVVVLR